MGSGRRSRHTGAVHKTIQASLDADAERVVAILSDLGNYPAWLDIVTHAVPAEAAPGDAGPAWSVTLRAKVGPFARSKRLRMVRTEATERRLRFERAELDGRTHSAWVLDVEVSDARPCDVQVDLRYDGGLWSAPLEAILGSQADDAVPRLEALVG